METIALYNVEGTAKLSGIDEYGNNWVQFEVDHFAEQEVGECAICDAELKSGWICLDGGDEVCASHVSLFDLVTL